jgi:hypothetical protein
MPNYSLGDVETDAAQYFYVCIGHRVSCKSPGKSWRCLRKWLTIVSPSRRHSLLRKIQFFGESSHTLASPVDPTDRWGQWKFQCISDFVCFALQSEKLERYNNNVSRKGRRAYPLKQPPHLIIRHDFASSRVQRAITPVVLLRIKWLHNTKAVTIPRNSRCDRSRQCRVSVFGRWPQLAIRCFHSEVAGNLLHAP